MISLHVLETDFSPEFKYSAFFDDCNVVNEPAFKIIYFAVSATDYTDRIVASRFNPFPSTSLLYDDTDLKFFP